MLVETEFGAMSGLVDSEKAVELGKLLGANLIVMGTIDDIRAGLVSVETGEVLWCRTYINAKQSSSKLDQSQVLTQVTKKVGDLFPSRK